MPDPIYDQAVESARREKAYKKLAAYYRKKPQDPASDAGIKDYNAMLKRWLKETPADIKKKFGIKGGITEPGIAEPSDAWRKRVGEEQAKEWEEAQGLVWDDLDNVDHDTLPDDVKAVWRSIDGDGKIDTRIK